MIQSNDLTDEILRVAIGNMRKVVDGESSYIIRPIGVPNYFARAIALAESDGDPLVPKYKELFRPYIYEV